MAENTYSIAKLNELSTQELSNHKTLSQPDTIIETDVTLDQNSSNRRILTAQSVRESRTND